MIDRQRSQDVVLADPGDYLANAVGVGLACGAGGVMLAASRLLRPVATTKV